MRLDLFSKGDSVLLLGDGNFSFTVSLHKHNLPIKIVATCFESKPEFEHHQENIEYLKSNKVPVFLNVDATKLRDNVYFASEKFSKIVFNFPHVGGKMKIHLNRELLRKVFESCTHVLAEDGLVIISLCKGQGGTPADQPIRRWHDSWQVTEMAAHADFLLVDVHLFLPHHFTDYHCIGYRGRDVRFHLSGALVHVFAKTKPLFPSITPTLPSTRLTFVPLKPTSHVLVPRIYSELYQTNPITNPHSPISFLKQLLLENVSEWNVLNDDDIPFYTHSGRGVPCRVNDVECTLRATSLDILPHLLRHVAGGRGTSKGTLFLGTYFSPPGRDWSDAPIEVNLMMVGEGLLDVVERLVKSLAEAFKEEDVGVSRRSVGNGGKEERGCGVKSGEELMVERRRRGDVVKAGVLWKLEYEGRSYEVCVMNGQGLGEYLFGVGWREMWGEEAKVVLDVWEKPCLRQRSLYPREYKMDVTLRYTEEYSEERLYELLWLAAGQVIEDVELLSEYRSAEGWRSKCYRLTYRSVDKALCRRKVVEIHSKIVGPVLQLGLNVAIG